MEANRIELGMDEWKQQSGRMQQIFGPGILQHRALERARLSHYRAVDKRPMPFMTNEEKLMRYLLRGEIKRMEKALYPSRLIRITRKIARVIANFKKEKITEPEEVMITRKINENASVSTTISRNARAMKVPEKNVSAKQTLLPKKKLNGSKRIKR